MSSSESRIGDGSNKVSELLSDFIRYYCFEKEQSKIEFVYRKPNIVKVYFEIVNYGPYRIEYKHQDGGDSCISYIRLQKTKEGFDEILMKQYINHVNVPLSNVIKR
jgi:hypothetical protein